MRFGKLYPIGAWILASCSAEREVPNRAEPADSPQAVVERFLRGIYHLDGDVVVQSLVGVEAHHRDAVKVLVQAVEALRKLRARFIDAYGISEWARFVELDHAANFSADSLEADEIYFEANKLLVENGVYLYDLYRFPKSERRARIEKVEGGWLLSADTVFGDANEVKACLIMAETLTSVLDDFAKILGCTTFSVEDIDYEMSRTWFYRLGMSSEYSPQRFSVIEEIEKCK